MEISIYLFIAIPFGVAEIINFTFKLFSGQMGTFLEKFMNLFKFKPFFNWKKYLVQPLKC